MPKRRFDCVPVCAAVCVRACGSRATVSPDLQCTQPQPGAVCGTCLGWFRADLHRRLPNRNLSVRRAQDHAPVRAAGGALRLVGLPGRASGSMPAPACRAQPQVAGPGSGPTGSPGPSRAEPRVRSMQQARGPWASASGYTMPLSGLVRTTAGSERRSQFRHRPLPVPMIRTPT
jgi:hypothetical protein